MSNQIFVAFDTETSGAWPVSSEVIEFGAVKFTLEGEVLDEMNVLIKPRRPLTEDNIRIHGITNEMLVDKRTIGEEIEGIYQYMKGHVCVAHHAPFDLGFMSIAFEDAHLSLSFPEALCSSLLSRRLIPESGNHKLQTLVKFLKIDGGQAHRASDDAQACMRVFMECVQRARSWGAPKTESIESETMLLAKLYELQGKSLPWSAYSLKGSGSSVIAKLSAAIRSDKLVDMVYEGGSMRGKTRPVKPIGIVRNPDGDFLYATCLIEHTNKRFFIAKIEDLELRE